MFFYLSKILYFLIQPINWVFLLLFLALFAKDNAKRRRCLIGGIILLYLFSNHFVFNEFLRAWEVPLGDQNKLNNEYTHAVVLGGIVRQVDNSKNIDFNRNADRILQILPFYFSGKVKKIIISGGSGSLIHDNIESDMLEEYLIRLGVKKEDLILERKSRNTYENALFTKKILEKLEGSNKKILLCTSSIHMRRSIACFTKQEIIFDSFAVDSNSGKRRFYPSNLFIPSASVLAEWYPLIHEWTGVLIYKIMGYC